MKVFFVYTGNGPKCGHIGIYSSFENALKAIHEIEPNLDRDFKRGTERDGSVYFFYNSSVFFYEIFETKLDETIDWDNRY